MLPVPAGSRLRVTHKVPLECGESSGMQFALHQFERATRDQIASQRKGHREKLAAPLFGGN